MYHKLWIRAGVTATTSDRVSKSAHMYIYKYIYIYIYVSLSFYIYKYVSEVGGVSPTGRSYSFRSFVRASEAACGRRMVLLPWLGFGSSQRGPVSCGVPCPSLPRVLNHVVNSS